MSDFIKIGLKIGSTAYQSVEVIKSAGKPLNAREVANALNKPIDKVSYPLHYLTKSRYLDRVGNFWPPKYVLGPRGKA